MRIRHFRTCAGFIRILILAIFISGCFSDNKQNVSDISPKTIRIGTYNVQDLFDEFDDPALFDGPPAKPEKLEALAEIILKFDCDILALQEVENIEFLERFNSEYLNGKYSEVILEEGSDPRGIDVAILSDLPILSRKSFSDRILKSDSEKVLFPRKVLAVNFISPDNEIWTFITVHLKAGPDFKSCESRISEARAIAEICRDEGYVNFFGKGRVILAGDLNSEPSSEAVRILKGVPFSDPARDLPQRATHKSGKTFDYILLSPDADYEYIVGSIEIFHYSLSKKASDHFPVTCEINFR